MIHGQRVGKTLEYPTANIDIQSHKVKLHEGVYAARAVLHGQAYHAVFTVNHRLKKVEVHLIGYRGDDFYGEQIRIEPIQQISRLEQWDSVEELKLKIEKDIQLAQRVLVDEG